MIARNWRTTLAGLAAALGTAAQHVDDPRLRVGGLIVAVLALLALGLFAGDSSAQVPTLPPAPPSEPPPPVTS
jgi:hypothetical protein